MNNTSYLGLIVVFCVGITSAYADIATDKQAVETACAQEAAEHCGLEKADTGLVGCLSAYKRSNKSTQISEACKTALMTVHKDIQTAKNNNGHQ